jgi:hypothetical protein
MYRNTPQPDVLLVAEGMPDIVVERTSVVWPDRHVADHKRIHQIGDRLNQEFGRHYSSSPVVFECNGAELPELRALTAALDSLCHSIAAGRTRGSKPFPWRLRPFLLGFDDDGPQTGIGVVVSSTDRWSSPQTVSQARNDALTGFSRGYRKALVHASEKFQSYPDDHHIVLVQFLGDDEFVLDEDVNGFVREADIPPLNDEVWGAYHDWQDEDNYKIGWQRLR